MRGKRFYSVCIAITVLSAASLTFADDKPQGGEAQDVDEIRVQTIERNGESTGGHVLILKNDQGGKDGKLIRVFVGDEGGIGGLHKEWITTTQEKASRYMLGVECESVSDILRHHLDLNSNVGLAIQNVVDDSAAEKAGLKQHDIIVQLGDSPIANVGDVGKALDDAKGAEIEIHFIRRGETQTAKITPIERKPITRGKIVFKHDSGESNVDIDVESITEGILSVSPGLRFKADSQIKDALKQAMSARRAAGGNLPAILEQLSNQQDELSNSRIERLEELQKKQTEKLEQQIKELKKMIESLTETSEN